MKKQSRLFDDVSGTGRVTLATRLLQQMPIVDGCLMREERQAEAERNKANWKLAFALPVALLALVCFPSIAVASPHTTHHTTHTRAKHKIVHHKA